MPMTEKEDTRWKLAPNKPENESPSMTFFTYSALGFMVIVVVFIALVLFHWLKGGG